MVVGGTLHVVGVAEALAEVVEGETPHTTTMIHELSHFPFFFNGCKEKIRGHRDKTKVKSYLFGSYFVKV